MLFYLRIMLLNVMKHILYEYWDGCGTKTTCDKGFGKGISILRKFGDGTKKLMGQRGKKGVMKNPFRFVPLQSLHFIIVICSTY